MSYHHVRIERRGGPVREIPRHVVTIESQQLERMQAAWDATRSARLAIQDKDESDTEQARRRASIRMLAAALRAAGKEGGK